MTTDLAAQVEALHLNEGDIIVLRGNVHLLTDIASDLAALTRHPVVVLEPGAVIEKLSPEELRTLLSVPT